MRPGPALHPRLRQDVGAGPSGDRYRWTAMGVVTLGTFMVVLDATIVNVALPQIGIAMRRDDGIDWIVTAYLLAVGVAQPPTAWLADRFGRKHLFMVSIVLFTLGSMLAALSPTLELLIAARVVQGFGGGALMPAGMAIIFEAFPPNRSGAALGVWGIAAMAAPAFGPLIGGYVVTTLSWHWLFLINIPVGIVSVVACQRLLRDTGYRERRSFDGLGLALVTLGLVFGLIALARASSWGWSSFATVGLLVAAAGFLTAFVLWERQVEHPAIDVTMFRFPIFSLSLAVFCAAVVVQYAVLVFVPLTLETVRGFSALRVGAMLFPTALGGAIFFPIAGRLTDRIGPRVPVMAGLAVLSVSALMLGTLDVDSPIWVIEVALLLQGFGGSLATLPNAVTGVNALPRRFVAQANAVRELNQRVVASFGIAVLGTVVATRLGAVSAAGIGSARAADAQDAYNTVFLLLAGIATAAILLAAFLPGRRGNAGLHADRSLELQDGVPEFG